MSYAESIAAKFKPGDVVECIDAGPCDAWHLPRGVYKVERVSAPNLYLVGWPMAYAGRRFKLLEAAKPEN